MPGVCHQGAGVDLFRVDSGVPVHAFFDCYRDGSGGERENSWDGESGIVA